MSDTKAFSSNKDDAEKRLHDVTWTAPGFDSAPLPSTSQGFIMLTSINQPADALGSGKWQNSENKMKIIFFLTVSNRVVQHQPGSKLEFLHFVAQWHSVTVAPNKDW